MKHFLLPLMLLAALTAGAQTAYNLAAMRGETLDRGLVAVRISTDSVLLSWRYLPSDPIDVEFQVLRDGKVIGHTPARHSTTFADTLHSPAGAHYRVIAKSMQGGRLHHARGDWTLPEGAPVGYVELPLTPPADVVDELTGKTVSYVANDATMADLTGDGRMEVVLKWDPTNSRDNSHSGLTAPTYLEALTLEGRSLWRVCLGRNIRSGAHYTPFIVADLNGDGRAEMLVRTSDGTVDGRGHVLGDPMADHRRHPDTLAYQANGNPSEQFRGPGWPDRMDPKARRGGFVDRGPEWVTCFDGRTGKAVSTVDYIPERGPLSDWGDNYANRSDRFLAACAYLDGKRLSAIFCRGYYTRTVLAAYDFDGRRLTTRWVFDTRDAGKQAYAGQGNHNLRVADVDGDGCDEITYGSMAVDHDGQPLYNTGFGHGDAMHLTAFMPLNDALYVWDCHENRRDGSDFRDARTGLVLFQLPSSKDVGRCMAADIDPRNPGLEMWSSASGGIRSTSGEVVDSMARVPINYGIWWDGDLLRELLDHETISKYVPAAATAGNAEAASEETLTGTPYDFTGSRACIPLIKLEGVAFNNGTKSNPCLAADVVGDWREEVLARTPDSRALRLYVSPLPTPYRFHTFLADPVYRHSLVMQNVGYNQPTNVGFYFGAELQGSGRLFRGWQF